MATANQHSSETIDYTQLGTGATYRSPCVVSIGNFDGCHLGHQTLLRSSIALGDQLNLPVAVLSFEPSPQIFFGRRLSGQELFTSTQKTQAVFECGAQQHFVQRFHQDFHKITYQDFYRGFLRQFLNARGIVVGENFRFGQRRLGGVEELRALIDKDPIDVQLKVLPSLMASGSVVSSTRIRAALVEKGDVSLAKELLGRPYVLQGTVERGRQVGRKLGYPTMNLGQVNQLLPAQGVYAGYVALGDGAPITQLSEAKLAAVFSLGARPTFASGGASLDFTIEAHILDFAAETASYGTRASYFLTHHLRPNRSFPSSDALKQAIAQDVASARRLLFGE